QDMLIFDRHGNLLADVGDQRDHRIVVPISYISPNIIDATIAIEDHTFYSNSGVDPTAILRAALADYSHHGIKQGGSTISQQLVKQLFIGPNPDNSIQRKAAELPARQPVRRALPRRLCPQAASAAIAHPAERPGRPSRLYVAGSPPAAHRRASGARSDPAEGQVLQLQRRRPGAHGPHARR